MSGRPWKQFRNEKQEFDKATLKYVKYVLLRCDSFKLTRNHFSTEHSQNFLPSILVSACLILRLRATLSSSSKSSWRCRTLSWKFSNLLASCWTARASKSSVPGIIEEQTKPLREIHFSSATKINRRLCGLTQNKLRLVFSCCRFLRPRLPRRSHMRGPLYITDLKAKSKKCSRIRRLNSLRSNRSHYEKAAIFKRWSSTEVLQIR